MFILDKDIFKDNKSDCKTVQLGHYKHMEAALEYIERYYPEAKGPYQSTTGLTWKIKTKGGCIYLYLYQKRYGIK